MNFCISCGGLLSNFWQTYSRRTGEFLSTIMFTTLNFRFILNYATTIKSCHITRCIPPIIYFDTRRTLCINCLIICFILEGPGSSDAAQAQVDGILKKLEINLPGSNLKSMGGGVVIDLEHNDDYGMLGLVTDLGRGGQQFINMSTSPPPRILIRIRIVRAY